MSRLPPSDAIARERHRLGLCLALARARAGMTQDAVAEKLRIRRPTLSAWEGGNSEPLTLQLVALAELYGLSLEALVGRADLPPLSCSARLE